MNQPLLEVTELNVNYDKTPVLLDVSFSVPGGGKMVGIIGPNGAGKSTLIKSILGLVKPLSGKVLLQGKNVRLMRKEIGYVPQAESVDWEFPITLFNLVLMGRYGRLGLLRRPKKKDRQKTMEILERVGLAGYRNRQINELSGGEKQRAFLARALNQEASLYFLDEPFVGIDVHSKQLMVELLQEQKKAGKTLFVVHHDLSTVKDLFDYTLLINMRLVAAGETSQIFCEENLQRTYGKDLLLDQVALLSRQKKAGTQVHA